VGNRQFTDNATSILAATITSGSTSVQVSTGQGALFPTLTGTEYFIAAIQDTAGNVEYVKVTAVSGDVFTVVRAQEGTTAQGFTANLARVELRNTAGTMSAMYQKDGDTLTGNMNGGGHSITNVVLGANTSMEAGTEIVNTPIRGDTGITTNQLVVPPGGGRATLGGVPIVVSTDPVNAFTTGMIVPFYGALGNVPAGWHLCDGTNGTPDLRDQRVIGAGLSYTLGQAVTLTDSTSSVSAGTPSINPVTLSVGNLPAHQHPFDYFFGNGTAVIGDPGFSVVGNYISGGSGTGTRVSYAGKATGSGTAFIPTAAALAAHQHTISDANNVALYWIMKL
jgi:hypothetical protein